jgi:hypothetical protein
MVAKKNLLTDLEMDKAHGALTKLKMIRQQLLQLLPTKLPYLLLLLLKFAHLMYHRLSMLEFQQMEQILGIRLKLPHGIKEIKGKCVEQEVCASKYGAALGAMHLSMLLQFLLHLQPFYQLKLLVSNVLINN